ncbi:MAG TPA: hypothetical protein VIG72_00090 [Pontibacter sp.]
MLTRYLPSAFYRNGEDLIFYDKEFHEWAYQIAMGPHEFEWSFSTLGFHLHFTTPEYELEVILEYGPYREGSSQIKLKYPHPSTRVVAFPWHPFTGSSLSYLASGLLETSPRVVCRSTRVYEQTLMS